MQGGFFLGFFCCEFISDFSSAPNSFFGEERSSRFAEVQGPACFQFVAGEICINDSWIRLNNSNKKLIKS